MWKVIEVIDGDTFRVSPDWVLGENSGDLVRPTGYNTPEQGRVGYEEAKIKLRRIILHKQVELKRVATIDRGRLVCDVYINGKYLADFFPEYKV